MPHLVELPGRGVGADMIGRAGALLVDIAVDTVPRGYRIAAGRGGVATGGQSAARGHRRAKRPGRPPDPASSDRVVRCRRRVR